MTLKKSGFNSCFQILLITLGVAVIGGGLVVVVYFGLAAANIIEIEGTNMCLAILAFYIAASIIAAAIDPTKERVGLMYPLAFTFWLVAITPAISSPSFNQAIAEFAVLALGLSGAIYVIRITARRYHAPKAPVVNRG